METGAAHDRVRYHSCIRALEQKQEEGVRLINKMCDDSSRACLWQSWTAPAKTNEHLPLHSAPCTLMDAGEPIPPPPILPARNHRQRLCLHRVIPRPFRTGPSMDPILLWRRLVALLARPFTNLKSAAQTEYRLLIKTCHLLSTLLRLLSHSSRRSSRRTLGNITSRPFTATNW